MKPWLFAALLLLVAQQPPMPPPGNPGHQEPAPGQACLHDSRDPAHNCTCHRECQPSEDEDGHQTQTVKEDAKCRSYCYHDHCHCPIANCD